MYLTWCPISIRGAFRRQVVENNILKFFLTTSGLPKSVTLLSPLKKARENSNFRGGEKQSRRKTKQNQNQNMKSTKEYQGRRKLENRLLTSKVCPDDVSFIYIQRSALKPWRQSRQKQKCQIRASSKHMA